MELQQGLLCRMQLSNLQLDHSALRLLVVPELTSFSMLRLLNELNLIKLFVSRTLNEIII